QVYRNDTGAGTFVGWHGDVLFDDVALLSASMDALPEGLIVRTRQEGYSYKVAAPGASDHHLTFGPNKLYVLPQGGEYHLAAWDVDGTGATSAQDAFEAALECAIAEDVPLVLSQKEILLDGNNVFVNVTEGNRLRLRSPCGTTVRTMNMNLKFRGGGVRFSEALAADVERFGTQVTVSNTSGIKHGDLVCFKNTRARIDSNWSYPKYCVRRVQTVIDGATIELDQPLDMHFHRWEGNRNGRTVTAITQASPGVVTAAGHGLSEGDYIRLDFIEGMTELAGNVYRVGSVSGDSFDLLDEDNNPVDTSTFGSYVANSAEVFEQGQTEIEIRPRASVDLDNINFLVGVNKVAIFDIDVATGQITTAAAHGLATGDIVTFQGVEGTTELNEQDYEAVRISDTVFTLRDFDDVAISTAGMTPYVDGGYVHSSPGDYNSTIAFDYISGSVQRCSFAGAIPGWLPGTVDTARVTSSDGLDFDLCHFERGRYCPLIQGGARNTRIKRSTVSKIRHIDIAGWAQDTLIEDVTGNDTDSIIESHPCIRPVWRRIRDSVRHTLNSALDIRGVGEIVEDCKSWSTAGVSVGTQEFTPVRAYEDWVASFTRRITGFESRTGCISSGSTMPMIVERCDVPYISEGGSGALYVDEHTKWSAMPDRSVATSFAQIVMPHRIDLPKVTAYASERRTAEISGITNANPAVVTATAHGFTTGDTVLIEDVEGMIQINGETRTITVIDPDTFSFDRNATGYGAYTGGGVAWAEATIRDIADITPANPGVVTAAGHGFSDGDVVWISGASGMTGVNQAYYVVANATTNTFALFDLAGAAVDTSGFGAYTSGGKVTRQASFDAIDLATKPNVGTGRVGLTTTQLYAETAHSATTVNVPFIARFQPPGAISNENYHVQIVLKAMTRGGYAESRYNLVTEGANSAGAYNFVSLAESDGMGGASVRLKGVTYRDSSRVQDEGESNFTNSKKAEVNERWCAVGAVEVGLDSSNDHVLSLDVELDVRAV
ncbi:ubiquitin-activating E1 FCCH domain-containing protein, partial [uncultured Mameliella sp.]|uniref:ubiquitin-activating E1 FCCH domain-containing protein n=1 Tax=uncultured Mameliella sp. TaxID=1447087 RepID=UPI00261066E4